MNLMDSISFKLILISDYAEGDYMISSCFLQKQNKNIKFFFSELRDLQAC